MLYDSHNNASTIVSLHNTYYSTSEVTTVWRYINLNIIIIIIIISWLHVMLYDAEFILWRLGETSLCMWRNLTFPSVLQHCWMADR